jgi:protein-ribulosamine 3-kinase
VIRPLLEASLRRALGDTHVRILGVNPTGGGCIHNAARLSTTAGDYFAKWNADCPADAFLREADGLREIGGAASGLVVPEVLDAAAAEPGAPGFILMEYLPPDPGSLGHDEALGAGLAALHRRTSSSYGFETHTYCGPTRQDNTRTGSWPEFYGERRIAPLLRLIDEEHRMTAAERRQCERLIEKLPALLPQGPPAALIHGDLWSGNVMRTARGPALVDPACAYADREMEFGITTLFGGFSPAFWTAYEEAQPLPASWRERNPLYQLYHLLNHFLIFGGHYGSEALAIVRRYV